MVGKIIAIASGKGGVGKTWLSISLAHYLAKQGKKTLLFDGDLGLANVDIQLGLAPEVDLGHYFAGQKNFSDLIMRDPEDAFDIIPGGSGQHNLANLTTQDADKILFALKALRNVYDVILLDLAAGVYETILRLTATCDQTLMVINQEPTSLTDAYAFIKLRAKAGYSDHIGLVVNQATKNTEAERAYFQLQKACKAFLNINPEDWGFVRQDTKVREAIQNQTSILTRSPTCKAAEDIEKLGQIVLKLEDMDAVTG